MSKAVRTIISTANAPKPVGPYNQAVRVDNTVYVSGVLGLNKDTMKLVDGGALEQAKQALNNLGNILKAADSCYSNVVKTTILLDDINDFGPINDLYKEYFKAPFPARSTFQVGKLPMMLFGLILYHSLIMYSKAQLNNSGAKQSPCLKLVFMMNGSESSPLNLTFDTVLVKGAKIEIEVIAIAGEVNTGESCSCNA